MIPHAVLVVDDNPTIRALLATVLRREGFHVILAANGEEAIDLYRGEGGAIDVVLSDVHMEGLDGPQTLAALRHQNPSVRCVFMSGDPGHYSVAQLLGFGACAFLEKPFGDLAQIAAVLRAAVGTRQAA